MKNAYIVFGMILVFAFESAAAVEEVDCFEYYRFQNGLVFGDLHSENYQYAAGDEVFFSYDLVNDMGSPVVEGKVRAQIFYNDSKEGEQMVDEFIAHGGINLMPGDELGQEIGWEIPVGAKPGKYILKTYFISGEAFNLAGLSFDSYGPPGVPGAMTSFEVDSSSEASRLYFSKNATYVNGAKYRFGSPLLSAKPKPFEIKTRLVNEGAEKKAALTMNVYEWDDVTDRPIPGRSITNEITLKADSAEDVSYDLPALGPGAYEVRFVAESSDERSILKLRIPVEGANGRLGYMGMDSFPLTKGSKTTLFFCLHNSADYRTSFNGTGKIELVDSEGNAIVSEGYRAVVDPSPSGLKLEFVPDRDVTSAVLKISLSDDKGNLMREETLRYDYSNFPIKDAVLEAKTDRAEYAPGENIQCSADYSDGKGRALKGKILAYVLDAEGRVVSLLDEREITGTSKLSLEAPDTEGTYSVIIKETTSQLKTQATFSVSKAAAAVTSSTAETVPATYVGPAESKTGASYDYLIPVAIILLIMAVFLMWRRKK